MDVDVALPVGLGEAGIQHIHVVELLRALGAELQHGAHGGIAVDVGVLALDVGVDGVLEGDVLEGLHQAGVHLAHAAALGPVEDVRLGGADKALLNQHPLHGVLHLLHGGGTGDVLVVLQLLDHPFGQGLGGFVALGAAGGLEGPENGVLDLLPVKGHGAAVALADVIDAHAAPPDIALIRFSREMGYRVAGSSGQPDAPSGCGVIPPRHQHLVVFSGAAKQIILCSALLVNTTSGQNYRRGA